MNQSTGIDPATSWHALHERYAAFTLDALEDKREQAEVLKDCSDEHLVRLLLANDILLSRAVSLLGQINENVYELWRHELPRAITFLKRTGQDGDFIGSKILSLSVALETVGFTRPDGVDQSWLASLQASKGDFQDHELRSLAFAALAMNRPEDALQFVDADPMPGIEAGRLFEFNSFDFIRYLAAAMVNGDSSKTVAPAWGEFVRLFPLNLAATAGDWPDLLHVSHAMANLDGREARFAADDLRRVVKDLL